MSFRDINIVLKKAAASLESETNKKQSDDSSSNGKATEIVDKATQAYKLFSEGKKPIEVAVNLGINGGNTIQTVQRVLEVKASKGIV
jgi:hypothetical protein